MKITCPTCETSYALADGALGATGRKVRCTRCGTMWHARPLPAEPAPAESEAEAEWAAMEAASTGGDAAGPIAEDGHGSDAVDDWRAALAEPEPRRTVTGGPLPLDDDDGKPAPDPEVRPDPDEVETRPGAADRGEAAAGEGPGTGMVAVESGSPGGPETREEGPARPVIDAIPSGFAARRGVRRPATPRKGPRPGRAIGTRIAKALVLTVAGGMVAVVLAGTLFAREALVRRFPDLAALYALAGVEVNLRGLAFRDLETYREIDGATPVLVVDGVIENVTDTVRPVPRLRFGLLSTSGREVYAWTMDPAAPDLEPGGTMPFKSRLPAPPEAAADVQVRFTDRRGP
jgi:predicted Zn finger-like uncharacterized protein